MNEGDAVSQDNIIDNWEHILHFYDGLIDSSFKLRPIRFLIRYITEQGYSKKIHGGTSMYSLLISLPVDNRIDYTKTLIINYDEQTQHIEFVYHDKPRMDRKKENIDWSITCQGSEIIDTFNHFLNENAEWGLIRNNSK